MKELFYGDHIISKLSQKLFALQAKRGIFGDAQARVWRYMAFDPQQIINSALMKVKADLISNITDPRAGARPTNSDFIVTAYPSHDIFYPHIVLYQVGGKGTPESINAPITFLYNMLISIEVFSKSTRELDLLCGNVIAEMLNNVAVYTAYGMHAMDMPLLFRNNPVTLPGVHRKSAEYTFNMHIAQA